MRVEQEAVGTFLVVRVSGEFDAAGVDAFRAAVEEGLAGSDLKSLVVDLRGVTFLDSSGLGALLGRDRRQVQAGGSMRLLNPSPAVKPILELSGIYRIMPVFESEVRALGSR